jgi:hypothetical protein
MDKGLDNVIVITTHSLALLHERRELKTITLINIKSYL